MSAAAAALILCGAALGAQVVVDTSGGAARRVPVTQEHLRTAARDGRARTILTGAREARLQQESALLSYDVRAYQRLSVNLAVAAFGRERGAVRREGATRIRWKKDAGALVEVEGARAAVPIVGSASADSSASSNAINEMLDGAIRLPYFPGSESLWLGSDVVKTEVDESSIIHPLAAGSEAYYRYATGDSAEYGLPDGTRIRIVELLITPRDPKWNLVVGSFWFDEGSFRPVRAVYRLSVPLDVWSVDVNDNRGAGNTIARALLSPMRGTATSIIVEYGLYEGRFWLPRLQSAQGYAQVSFVRIPFELQQKYDYLQVNGVVDIPAIPMTAAMARRDSVFERDSLTRLDDSAAQARARELTALLKRADSAVAASRVREREQRDSVRGVSVTFGTPLRRAVCDTAAVDTRYSYPYRGVRVMSTATCNDSLLVNSPQLPPSIFTPSSEIFDHRTESDLLDRLTMSLQAGLSPQIPRLSFGFGDGLLRYNRIEGLSPALRLSQQLGAGLAASATARYGTADHEVNGELALSRSNGRRTVTLAGYQRLVAINDWGSPLNFGSSFQALVFGRDEGFYYRGTGGELAITGSGTPYMEFRLFGERQHSAEVEAEFSVANALGDREFAANIIAEEGDVFGAASRVVWSLGTDPRKLRLLAQVKAENGFGDFTYGRGMFDVTVSRELFGRAGVALTVSAGSSLGHLPVQRHFTLGGTQSVRGQRPGTHIGDAFWMGRVELGSSNVAARRVFFADFGWAGSRRDVTRQSRSMSGVGIGWSFLDGMIRMDVARGLYPGKAWRFASYFEARY
jgi:hypothetical protein